MNLENVTVVKYEGPMVSREQYMKMQEYSAFERVFQEHKEFCPDIAKSIKRQVELKYGNLEPEIERYVKMRNRWIITLFKEYEQRGAKFAVNLHSTECVRPHSKGSEKAIHLIISYHRLNSKAKQLIRDYESIFNKRFKNDFFSSTDNVSSIPPVMMIELKNNPFFCPSLRAESIIRSFLAYLVETY